MRENDKHSSKRIYTHIYMIERELGEACNVGVCGSMHECVYIVPGAPPAVDLLERCCASIDNQASCIFSVRGEDQIIC